LHAATGGNIPVIGVAKNRFETRLMRWN
jgi:deoxyinosine 3'endonuclease (endonuclease V)